jgi:hypothetical protein
VTGVDLLGNGTFDGLPPRALPEEVLKQLSTALKQGVTILPWGKVAGGGREKVVGEGDLLVGLGNLHWLNKDLVQVPVSRYYGAEQMQEARVYVLARDGSAWTLKEDRDSLIVEGNQ